MVRSASRKQESDDYRNVAVLAGCQAMLLTANATLIAINSLAGLALAPTKLLATLPVTFWILGSAIATLPASLHMARVGRQRGLTSGVLWGIAGALVCGGAIAIQSFGLLCFGTLVCGVYNAYGQYFRFAAADASKDDFRATAISLVVAAGLLGGVIGPTTSRLTIDLLTPRFLGAYLALLPFALLSAVLIRFARLPHQSRADGGSSGRPLARIARQRKFIVAVLCGAIGNGVMNFLMTSTPIAMHACGHVYSDATLVISSHVVAMFAPSLFTGALIKRFGVLVISFVGGLLQLGAIAIALSGSGVRHFWWSLVLLGMGWNLLHIGGTTLLTETYLPEERAKAQGANEQAIFILTLLASVASGTAVTARGWDYANLLALPLVALVVGTIAYHALYERLRSSRVTR